MTKQEALTWLDRLKDSKSKKVRQMAYNRLKELLSALLPDY